MQVAITDGWTCRIGQSFLLIFFIPFNFLLLYSVFENINVDGLVFSTIIIAASILIIRNGFCYAEITLTDKYIIIRKLFKKIKVPVSKYKAIGKGIPTSSYYIEFDNKMTVYFLLNFTDSFREFFTLDPDKILKELKSKFEQAKANDKRSTANNS